MPTTKSHRRPLCCTITIDFALPAPRSSGNKPPAAPDQPSPPGLAPDQAQASHFAMFKEVLASVLGRVQEQLAQAEPARIDLRLANTPTLGRPETRSHRAQLMNAASLHGAPFDYDGTRARQLALRKAQFATVERLFARQTRNAACTGKASKSKSLPGRSTNVSATDAAIPPDPQQQPPASAPEFAAAPAPAQRPRPPAPPRLRRRAAEAKANQRQRAPVWRLTRRLRQQP